MTEPTVMWRDGDAWADLTFELCKRAVTVVSEHGTTRLIDLRTQEWWHVRLPIDDRYPLPGDFERRPLERVLLTSCGVVLHEPSGASWFGTPVRLLLDGIYPDWADTAVGLDCLVRLRADLQPLIGHPPRRCPALYCRYRRGASGEEALRHGR